MNDTLKLGNTVNTVMGPIQICTLTDLLPQIKIEEIWSSDMVEYVYLNRPFPTDSIPPEDMSVNTFRVQYPLSYDISSSINNFFSKFKQLSNGFLAEHPTSLGWSLAQYQKYITHLIPFEHELYAGVNINDLVILRNQSGKEALVFHQFHNCINVIILEDKV